MHSEAAQHAGHTPHTGAPPAPPPGAGAGFMVGQPTPATCRAQRYSCLLPGGQGRGRREVGAWPAAVVTQGLTVTSSANMPAQGPPPTLALAHRLCPGAYWASSAGSGAGQLQGSPQPRIPHNTRGLPTTPGSRRASAAPRGPTVCRPGAHPTSQGWLCWLLWPGAQMRCCPRFLFALHIAESIWLGI